MNTKTIVWALVAIVVFGGVWYLATSSMGGNVGGATATTSPTSSTVAPARQTTSSSYVAPKPVKTAAKTAGIAPLTSLMSMKQALLCSFKTMSGVARSGTLYVAPGLARLNLSTASMIDDGTYLYVWTKGVTTGTKLLAASSVSGSAVTSKGGVDPAADLSFSCNLWTVDGSVFLPPASVSF